MTVNIKSTAAFCGQAAKILSVGSFLLLCAALASAGTPANPEAIPEISPMPTFLAPRVLDPVYVEIDGADAPVSDEPIADAEPVAEPKPAPASAPTADPAPTADVEPAAAEPEPESTAGFVLESTAGSPAGRYVASEPAPKSTAEFEAESAAAAPYADLRRSIDELQEELRSLQTQVKKKQDVPDTSKKFSAKAGGMLAWDSVTIDQSDENRVLYGDIDNDFASRDLRLWVKGEGYDNLDYEVCLGYTGSLSFKNVMLTAKNVPLFGTARIGYFKVESGLNFASNVYDNTFVDWESCDRTFQVGRRLGVGSIHYNEDKSLRFFTGVYTGQNLAIGDGKHANENNDNVGLILNTRLTAVPIYSEGADGELLEVLHLGAGLRWVDPGHDSKTGADRPTTLRAAPVDWLSDMTPLLSGSIVTNSYTVTNVEAAWQKSRFGVIGEGHIGNYSGYDNAYGVSATGRFLLTPGAYQKYNKSGGCFAGIAVPANMRFVDCENWTCLEGGGVWEVAAQWAWTDLDMLRDVPASVRYGRMNQYTLALNWYWNPQTRWGLNWIYAKPESGFGGAEAVSSSLNTLACQVRFTF